MQPSRRGREAQCSEREQGQTQRYKEVERNSVFQMHGIPQHLQSLGVKGELGPQENRGGSELGEERDQEVGEAGWRTRRSLVLAQEVSPPPTPPAQTSSELEHHSQEAHPFPEERQRTGRGTGAGLEPKLSDSAQRLLQGKFRRGQGCRAQLRT